MLLTNLVQRATDALAVGDRTETLALLDRLHDEASDIEDAIINQNTGAQALQAKIMAGGGCMWPKCPGRAMTGRIYCRTHQRESEEIWQGIPLETAPNHKRILSPEVEADIEAKARADAARQAQLEAAPMPRTV